MYDYCSVREISDEGHFLRNYLTPRRSKKLPERRTIPIKTTSRHGTPCNICFSLCKNRPKSFDVARHFRRTGINMMCGHRYQAKNLICLLAWAGLNVTSLCVDVVAKQKVRARTPHWGWNQIVDWSWLIPNSVGWCPYYSL